MPFDVPSVYPETQYPSQPVDSPMLQSQPCPRVLLLSPTGCMWAFLTMEEECDSDVITHVWVR
jgi:hypothetical protein